MKSFFFAFFFSLSGFVLFPFSMAAQPTITSFSPSSGAVGTLVTIKGSNLSAPTAFTIGGVAAILVSNNDSSLVGMVMPNATAGTISVSTAAGLTNGIGNFIVTPTPYPAIQQGNKLSDPQEFVTIGYGAAVALSADGNTALVGGPFYNTLETKDAGAVWVYTRSGGNWLQQGEKLIGTGAAGGAKQGTSVSISADGNTAIIGGPNDENTAGAVWVFTRTDTTWTQQGNKLVASGAVGKAMFGKSVSLSADGNTALVGGANDNNHLGAVWVFTRYGTNWTQMGSKLVANESDGYTEQGSVISLSADGNTAILGQGVGAGGAWVFVRSGNSWNQQGNKLIGTGGSYDAYQGSSVALSADGNTAIIGGIFDQYNGASWIFTRSGNLWTQQGNKLVGSGAISDGSGQGALVSLSADGNTAIVTSTRDNGLKGATWVFARSGTTWTQRGSKLVGTGAVGNGLQGVSAALSADGSTAMVGGIYDEVSGAAWVFVPTPAPIVTSFSPSSGPVGTLVSIKGNYLGNPTGIKIGGVPGIVLSQNDSSIVGMVMPGATTGTINVSTTQGASNGSSNFTVSNTLFPDTQQGSKLVGADAIGNAQQGSGVSLSADGNTAIVGGRDDKGAAWIYTRKGSTWTQQGNKLVGSGIVGFSSGGSVSISADGNTAILGENTSQNVGAASVFVRKGGSWVQQGSKLVGTGAVGLSVQGRSVALSLDGNTAIVGGTEDNNNIGAAWIFTRSDTTWKQQGSKLVGSGYVGSSFQGYSVSLSADGNTAIVGGLFDSGNIGAAWIYTRNGSTWTQQGSKLVGTGALGKAYQGASVALSADGNTAIVGGYGDSLFAGAAWIFVRNGNIWTQQGSKLVGIGAEGDANQGISVSLTADGNTAIVGGPRDKSYVGAAWIFTRNGSTWTQRGSKLVGTGAIGKASQGQTVSLSADGTTALVGGINDSSYYGASWVYISMPVFTFTGSGNWDNPSNWSNNQVPPEILPANAQIIINPTGSSECILNVPVTVPANSKIIVVQGKIFRIQGNLNMQ